MMNAALDAIKRVPGSKASTWPGNRAARSWSVAWSSCATTSPARSRAPDRSPRRAAGRALRTRGERLFRRDAERAAGGAKPLAPPAAGERSGEQAGPDRPADRLRRPDAPVGRAIPQFLVEATDEEHHGVVVYSELVAAGCVLGKTDQEIARAVSTLVSAASNTTRAPGANQFQARHRGRCRAPAGGGCARRARRCLIVRPHPARMDWAARARSVIRPVI